MKRWLPLVALLLGCTKPEPTFPAASQPSDAAIAAECGLLESVLPRLIAASPQGNVVFSPHTLAAALAAVQSGKGSTSMQWKELDAAKAEELDANRLREHSVIGPIKELKKPSKGKLAGSDFVRNELEHARAKSSSEAWVALFDAQVAGVPMVSRTLFLSQLVEFSGNMAAAGAAMQYGAHYGVSPYFRSAFWSATSREGTMPAGLDDTLVVTFSLPVNEADAPAARLPVLPCGGGGLPEGAYRVALDFRAPTFCARTQASLAEVAPDLRATLPADVLLSARLGFDARGTINLPPHAVRSPSVLRESDWGRTAHELHLDRPFYVTVHQRSTGHILYVAYVREANDVNGCREPTR